MTLTLTDDKITSNQTPHTATAWPVPDEPAGWSVTWLPGWNLTRNQAITAMTLAEQVDRNGLWDYRNSVTIDACAAELGLTGPQAIGMIGVLPQKEDPMEPEPVTHYGHCTAGLVGDVAPRIACGTQHWAVVSEHAYQVTCPDCHDAERLAEAVERVLKRHQPKTVTVREMCLRHASGGWDGVRTVGQQFDACPDCTSREQVTCTGCDPVCPDDNLWPCETYRAITRELLAKGEGHG